MEAKVIWQQRMAFTASADTGYSAPLDAEAGVGDESGFRPMEMIAMGLAGCTAMDVISILTKKRQNVTAFEVQVHAQRAGDHPKVFTEAVIEYLVTGVGIDPQAVLRAIELSATRYCPAQAMLAKAFPMQLKFSVYEQALPGEAPLLVESGEFLLAAG
jgi:putative redox protein